MDADGNAHVIGMTASVAFPVSNAVETQHSGGTWDVFAVKLNAAGTAAFYSTYLGGTGDDRGQGIVLDGPEGAIIGGLTASAGTTLGTTAGVVQPANAGGTDAFVAKLTDAANHAPTLPDFGTVAVNQGSIVNLSFAAKDADPNTTLTYSIDNLPVGAAFNTSTGAFSWTVPQQGALNHTATVTVTDGTSPDTTTVTVLVNGVAAAGREPASPSGTAASSGTFAAGTSFSNFVSETSDPLGPFKEQGVHYLGTGNGGSAELLSGARLIYRHRIEYGQPVSVSGVTVGGAAFNGSTAVLRLLAGDGETVLGTFATSGGNSYRTFTLNLAASVVGTTFFVDEFDTSST